MSAKIIRLRYLTLSVVAVLIVVSTVPFISSISHQPELGFTVPSWIKNNAGWWADGQIDNGSFVSGMQWLISNDIIALPPTKQGAGDGDSVIPGWIKNTAGWWAEDKIHDTTFVAAIRYMINEGIMIVEQELEEAEEPVEEVVEINDFYMEVNGGNCCINWAYIGKDYRFQIETLDKQFGNYIDGVNINVKIISKDSELRRDIGEVITKDGVYTGSTKIPGSGSSSDWYGKNILSVIGEYFGIEKTIEKEFTVFIPRYNATG